LLAELAVYKSKSSSGAGEGAPEEDEEAAALKEEMATVKARVDAARLDLAAVNKRHAELSRKYDAVPLRAELVQYQRRFVELYDEIAAKHRETKQYYTLYNSLEDQKVRQCNPWSFGIWMCYHGLQIRICVRFRCK
jgi:predicted  nucleic acid-binding Zn-ribbon protein